MSKVSISEASRLTGKPRSTIHRHIKKGKISVEKNGEGKPTIDIVELERVYGELQHAGMKQNEATIHVASPSDTAVDREELAALKRETTLLREQLDDKNEVIEDLRRRLDEESEERRKLTMMLTYQPPKKKTVLNRIFGIGNA